MVCESMVKMDLNGNYNCGQSVENRKIKKWLFFGRRQQITKSRSLGNKNPEYEIKVVHIWCDQEGTTLI